MLPVFGIALGLGVAGDALARKYTASDIESLMALHYGYIVNVEDAGMRTTKPAGAMVGGLINIINDYQGLRVGDCVSVEEGRYANIRQVSDTYCEEEEPSRQMVRSSAGDASDCRLATDDLLDARVEEQAKAAEPKVWVFCR